MSDSKKEIRYLRQSNAVFDELTGIVSGYAILYKSQSVDLGGFTEIIGDGALDGVLEKSDIVVLFEHNANNGLLARSKMGEGTLTLKIDNKGLFFSFELGDTSLARDMREYLKRGDIDGCSFSFAVDKEIWDMSSTPPLRTIEKFAQIFDLSIVIFPAYQDTTVALRSIPVPERKLEIDQYINTLFK